MARAYHRLAKAWCAALLLVALSACSESDDPADGLTIFTAASAAAAIETIGQQFSEETGIAVTVVPGSSAVLARQIVQGAPAHVYISANRGWTDYLISQRLARDKRRLSLMGNQLALVTPADANAVDGRSLPEYIRTNGRMALCDESAPCGLYARQALSSTGAWRSVSGNVVSAGNATTTLAMVEQGQVAAAIVYATDALSSTQVNSSFLYAPGTHEDIVYEAIPVGDLSYEVIKFFGYLYGETAQSILRAYGFQTDLTQPGVTA